MLRVLNPLALQCNPELELLPGTGAGIGGTGFVGGLTCQEMEGGRFGAEPSSAPPLTLWVGKVPEGNWTALSLTGQCAKQCWECRSWIQE